MPRVVRNSWVELRVDGHQPIATGPKNEGGTLTARFFVRDKGTVADSVTIRTHVDAGGRHHLTVVDPSGALILYDHATER